MFQPIQPFRLPTTPVDSFSVTSASFGGGYIVQLTTEGRLETAVFADIAALTQYLKILLSGQALAQGTAPDAPEASEPVAATLSVSTSKRKGGRPRLTEAEKAANRARRQALKSNGAEDHSEQNANPTHETAETVTA